MSLKKMMFKTTALAMSAGLMMVSAAPAVMAQAETPQAQPAPAQPAPAQRPSLREGIIAVVNDELISSYDLRQRMLLLIVTSGVQVTEQNYEAFQQQALRSLIDERLELQEAKRWDLKVEDAEITDEITRMAAQSNLSYDQLVAELQRAGVDPETLRNQIRAETGWQRLVGGRFNSKARVGKDQVDSYMARVGKDQVDSYMAKITADSQKPQYLVAEIFLDPNLAGGVAEAQAGAQQLFQQIASGAAPFQSVARQFSNAPSAANGGDAGWLISGTIDPKIETVLQTMSGGQMTQPITTDEGVYIYYLREKTDGNSDSVMALKQAAISLGADAPASRVEAAQKALESFRNSQKGCGALTDTTIDGNVVVTDLGETPLSELRDDYAAALKPLNVGQMTAPMRNDVNMNVLVVCDKRLAGENAPTREQIEDRLVNQRLSMLGRRYLRDVRNQATIENK
ncbi:peptidylprolyl isomerase [Asticcacaulis sp. SL142]|uniref:peptidylprolyl isomerase n=1 Tax=Asticcacaulis sp. SL142 TaxID=2995155 RepID=UPI00226D3AC1|nr:peptidylprolyl isomerase [Asticcacaulis sp. SL142]WAC48680.1 peptidylprolyl isomerase [Asticcacaulis sp. SL142]